MTSSRESHNPLPSFLQDLVQSPSDSPSPTSSSSADLSYDGSSEDAHYVLTPGSTSRATVAGTSSRQGPRDSGLRKNSSSSFSSLGRSSAISIWKLDGEESKTYTSSSARTSPTARHTQALSVGRNAHADDPAAAGSFADVDFGITPKGSGIFWQTTPRYT